MGTPTSGLLWGGLFPHQRGGERDGDLDSVVLHLRDYNEGSLLWLRGQVVHILTLCEALCVSVRMCVCVCVCAHTRECETRLPLHSHYAQRGGR